jgi:hypothetical protein
MTCSRCLVHFKWSYVNPIPRTDRISADAYANPNAIEAYFKATLRSNHHQYFIEHEFPSVRMRLVMLVDQLNKELRDNFHWITKMLSRVTKTRSLLENCYCYAHYTFEMEKIALEITKIPIDKKKKNTVKTERKKEQDAITLYFNLFNNHMELLEDTIEHVMVEVFAIEDHFIKSEYDKNDNVETIDDKLRFLRVHKSKMSTLMAALEKQKEGLLDVILKRDMKEFD